MESRKLAWMGTTAARTGELGRLNSRILVVICISTISRRENSWRDLRSRLYSIRLIRDESHVARRRRCLASRD